MARRLAFLATAFFLSALGIWAGAPAALAHATIVSTNPAAGAVVPDAPIRVTMTFDEPVGVSTGSLRVLAPNGSRVDTGGTMHGRDSEQIVVYLRGGLDRGTYTVAWHVISDDSHPVQGAFTFSVGAPSATSVHPANLNATASALAGIAFGVVRWVAFCSLALLVGAVGFVLWCWPAGASSPLVLRLTMGAWSALAGSVLGAVLLQGVYAAGQGVGHVFLPSVLHATLYSRYGRALGVRLILVIIALFVFTATLGNLRVEGRRVSVATSATWAMLAVALAATWAAADHAGTGIQVPLSVVSDTVHLCAVAIWLGGLTMLTTIVLRRPKPGGPRSTARPASRKGRAATAEAAQAVDRFSPLALGCVGVILLTGTYQAWRNVGSWPALLDTTYGRLLLVKIAAMCGLIGLGYLARIRIAALRTPASADRISAVELVMASLPRVGVGVRSGQDMPGAGRREGHGGVAGGSSSGSFRSAANGSANAAAGGSSPDAGRAAVTLGKLRWSVALEAMIAAAVLAVTAVLVNTPTAREAFTPPASAVVAFDTGGPGGRGHVSITVSPAVPGPNQVRISVTGSAGRPYLPKQIEAFLVLAARHLGPLSVPLGSYGPGRYASGAVTLPVIGQWQLRITVRSDAFDETTVAVPVPIR